MLKSDYIEYVNHDARKRLEAIKNVCNKYNLKASITVRGNEEKHRIICKAEFIGPFNEEHLKEIFKMNLYEQFKGIVDENGALITQIFDYRHLGMHINYYDDKGKPKVLNTEKIAFDYEANKIKYPKIHVNADSKIWGDHLSYPDSLNLDLNKMSFPLAMNIFYIYANNRDIFPTDDTEISISETQKEVKNKIYLEEFDKTDIYGEYI